MLESWSFRICDSSESQSDRVPRFETSRRHAFGCLPAGRPTVVRCDIRCGVESQARDDGVSMAVARVNCDPFAATSFAEVAELGRADRRLEQTRRAERVGHGARAIVTAISERFVAAAENVWFAPKLVRSPNGPFHCQGRTCRSRSLTGAEAGTTPRHGWTGSRENVRVRGRYDCGKNRRAN